MKIISTSNFFPPPPCLKKKKYFRFIECLKDCSKENYKRTKKKMYKFWILHCLYNCDQKWRWQEEARDVTPNVSSVSRDERVRIFSTPWAECRSHVGKGRRVKGFKSKIHDWRWPDQIAGIPESHATKLNH